MTRLADVLPQVEGLDPPDRAALLSHLAHGTAFPRIVRTPGVCGGDARFVRTRITVWAVEGYRRLGVSEPDLLNIYPTLDAADLAQAWAYVEGHRAEIDADIRANEEA